MKATVILWLVWPLTAVFGAVCFVFLVMNILARWHLKSEYAARKRRRLMARSIVSKMDDENMSNRYKYQDLPRSPHNKSIRLLKLEPAMNGLIFFSLITTDLNDTACPSYEALSYCWGDSQDKAVILDMNGRHMVITWNLYRALERFRYTDSTRLLWIDAVCINQENAVEKEAQVRMMVQIYERAACVLIWLNRRDDEPSDDGSPATDMLKTLCGAYGRYKAIGETRSQFDLSSAELKMLGVPSIVSHARPYRKVVEMMLSPWFQRAWIIQEVSVARTAVVFWLNGTIAWDELCNAWRFFASTLQMHAELTAFEDDLAIRNIERIAETADLFAQKRAGPLLQTLQRHRSSQATDPRDKIFALMHLANDGIDHVVSYHASCAEVYTETAKAIIRQTANLDILSFVATHPSGKDPELPSWVPDWRLTLDYHPLAFKYIHGMTAGDATPNSSARIHINGTGKRIAVQGYVLGAVKETSRALPAHVSTGREWYSMRRFAALPLVFAAWTLMCDPFSTGFYAPTGESMRTAFVSVVSCCASSANLAWREVHQETGRLALFFKLSRGLLWLSQSPFESAAVFWAFLICNWGRPIGGMRWRSGFVWTYSCASGRQMVGLEGGYLAMAPSDTEVGDKVVLVAGCRLPIILRYEEGKDGWTVVGESFVHGAMNGEIWEPGRCETIVLI